MVCPSQARPCTTAQKPLSGPTSDGHCTALTLEVRDTNLKCTSLDSCYKLASTRHNRYDILHCQAATPSEVKPPLIPQFCRNWLPTTTRIMGRTFAPLSHPPISLQSPYLSEEDKLVASWSCPEIDILPRHNSCWPPTPSCTSTRIARPPAVPAQLKLVHVSCGTPRLVGQLADSSSHTNPAAGKQEAAERVLQPCSAQGYCMSQGSPSHSL